MFALLFALEYILVIIGIVVHLPDPDTFQPVFLLKFLPKSFIYFGYALHYIFLYQPNDSDLIQAQQYGCPAGHNGSHNPQVSEGEVEDCPHCEAGSQGWDSGFLHHQ